MEYVYAAMLLHKTGHKIDEASIKKVVSAAGASPDEAKVKALVSALEGVNIDEVIKKAAAAPVAAAPAAAAPEAKKDEGPSDAEKAAQDEAASAGLAALFG